MKSDIHPTYFEQATVRCVCGNTFTVGATKESIEVEVCAKCHPFYTGKEKVLDAMGQIQKFKKRAEHKRPLKAKKLSKAE